MTTIADRLQNVVTSFHKTVKDIAAETGLPYRTLLGYLRAEREPNSEGLEKISRLGVNLNWLLTGEGEMFLSTVDPKDEQYRTPHAPKSDFSLLLEDHRLSLDSRTVAVWLANRPTGSAIVISELCQRLSIRVDRWRRIARELDAAGYLSRCKKTVHGRIAWEISFNLRQQNEC